MTRRLSAKRASADTSLMQAAAGRLTLLVFGVAALACLLALTTLVPAWRLI